MKKYFKRIKINEVSKENLLDEFLTELSKPEVSFVFKFTPGRDLLVYGLTYSIGGSHPKSLLPKAVQERDGEIVIPVPLDLQKDMEGKFEFFTMAITAVPKAIALITQINRVSVIQFSPKRVGDTKKIESGERWSDTVTYKVL